MATKTNLDKRYHVISRTSRNSFVFSFDTMKEVEECIEKWEKYMKVSNYIITEVVK